MMFPLVRNLKYYLVKSHESQYTHVRKLYDVIYIVSAMDCFLVLLIQFRLKEAGHLSDIRYSFCHLHAFYADIPTYIYMYIYICIYIYIYSLDFHSCTFPMSLCAGVRRADTLENISMVSCQKGPTRHAYAWQIGQDTLELSICLSYFVLLE